MSIATEITRLQTAKADLKTAIEAKGVTVGDITIDGYAAKVAEIPAGGGPTPPETPTDALLFYSTNEIGLSIANVTKNWDGTLYYSTDHTNWNTWDGTTEITSAKTGDWHKLYLRGVGNTVITGAVGSAGRMNIAGSWIKCVGNCNNLLDYTTSPTLGDNAFKYLFNYCANVDFDITLPATTLSTGCYAYMFNSCKSILKTPVLPATTLITNCYQSMFGGCTSLREAQPILATTMTGTYCCSEMFTNCYALKIVPDLLITTLGNYGCYQMFQGCSSLTTAPKLPALVLANSCYSAMFLNCKSLVSPPALPATTLAKECYYSMFSNCFSLATAPKLSATNMQTSCYSRMFNSCTSLTEIPALSSTALVSQCYYGMFQGCTNIKLSTEQTGDYQTEYRIPSNGATGTAQSNSLDSMFASTGGTFVGTPTINTTYYTSNTVIPAT